MLHSQGQVLHKEWQSVKPNPQHSSHPTTHSLRYVTVPAASDYRLKYLKISKHLENTDQFNCVIDIEPEGKNHFYRDLQSHLSLFKRFSCTSQESEIQKHSGVFSHLQFNDINAETVFTILKTLHATVPFDLVQEIELMYFINMKECKLQSEKRICCVVL